jgi:hypothetical protein
MHSEKREVRKRALRKIVKKEQVAHACNPSYSEGRDQEDRGSKPVWAESLQDPILEKQKQKTITQKRAGRTAQGVGRVQTPLLEKNKLRIKQH